MSSAAAIRCARSAALGASPLPLISSTGPSSVATSACSWVGCSGTGATKKRSEKTSVAGRLSVNAIAAEGGRPSAWTTTGASAAEALPGRPGAATVSSVGVEVSTRPAWPPNVTRLPVASGSKPRPWIVTRSPGIARTGLTERISGSRASPSRKVWAFAPRRTETVTVRSGT